MHRIAGAFILISTVVFVGLLWTPYLSFARKPALAGASSTSRWQNARAPRRRLSPHRPHQWVGTMRRSGRTADSMIGPLLMRTPCIPWSMVPCGSPAEPTYLKKR